MRTNKKQDMSQVKLIILDIKVRNDESINLLSSIISKECICIWNVISFWLDIILEKICIFGNIQVTWFKRYIVKSKYKAWLWSIIFHTINANHYNYRMKYEWMRKVEEEYVKSYQIMNLFWYCFSNTFSIAWL